MAAKAEAQDLEDLLDQLDDLCQRQDPKITVGEIQEAIGVRSFGPLLLLAGLLGMTPVSAVPGVPSLIALITILIAGQLLIGRKSFWLPKKLLGLSVKNEKLGKSVKVARKPAKFVDRLVRPRLTYLTKGPAHWIVALACFLVAVCVPPLELLPLAAILPSFAIATFGLGLIARDGVLVVIAAAVTATALGFVAKALFF
ncbi:exopolysaccharide biosynthesis protein [Phenylobacterium deserti]|uniref:Exopolysaccharide biosynthesis protein n=1 Tax=Phenylobacterium deserti TaxID=1914756 RepID=A0A328ACS0_9CAUL|nr:exopolysaccharide biosynthesis protein [Phenylobacterium deserti]RAK52297.1 exopolysaccharide biosynthesis protein [Phenylobacterium deserti]